MNNLIEEIKPKYVGPWGYITTHLYMEFSKRSKWMYHFLCKKEMLIEESIYSPEQYAKTYLGCYACRYDSNPPRSMVKVSSDGAVIYRKNFYYTPTYFNWLRWKIVRRAI